MHGGEVGAERACIAQDLDGGPAVGGDCFDVFSGLLGNMGVQGHIPLTSNLRGDRDGIGSDRPDRVDREAVGDKALGGQRRGAVGPCLDGTVTEADLSRVEIHAWTAGEVERVEQHQTDSRLLRRRCQGVRHLVRVGVRRASGSMVQVVELTDGRVAGEQHLREDRAGERVVARRVESRSGGVHLLAPRPEGIATPMRP